jgi:hypothetical protein
LTFVFSETLALSNMRSGEIGIQPEFSSARLLDALQGSYINQNFIDHTVNDLFIAACRNGDPWADAFQSMRNHIRYLYILKMASIQAFAIAPRCKWFLFLRPDLIWSDPLEVATLISTHGSSGKEMAITPSWHRWDGTNDRICLATREAAEVYGLRYESVCQFLTTEAKPLHAESFLQWCLDNRDDIEQLPIINTRAHRIRSSRSPLLIPEFDATLSGIICAQKALLENLRLWSRARLKLLCNTTINRFIRQQ